MEAGTKGQGSGTRTLLIVLLVLCGVILVSCLVCVVGSRISKHFEEKKEVKVAEKLLEDGKIAEAEKKFKEIGEYDKHKKDIEEKKKEEYARVVKEANKAFEEKNFEVAVKLYGDACRYGALDEDAEAKYKRAEILLLKVEVPKYLADAKGYLEGVNYDIALAEANKAIEGCDTLEKNAPDVAKEINTKKIRKEASALKGRINKEKARAEREKAIRVMESYEKDSGNIGIAVYGCKLKKAVSYYYVSGDSRFVLVGISAKNFGSGTEHVNPNDFTLSTPSGYTASHDVSTYSLGNYFDAVNLPPRGTTSGWIIFILPKKEEYRLNYESWGKTAKKKIYVTEGK